MTPCEEDRAKTDMGCAMDRNYEAMAVLSTAWWQYRALHAVRNLWIQRMNVEMPNFASDHKGLVQAEGK